MNFIKDDKERIDYLEYEIANRIIFSYIRYQHYSFDWQDYITSPIYKPRGIKETLQLIVENNKDYKIIILIDEFLKLSHNLEDIRQILSIIHSVRDIFICKNIKLGTCISSLTYIPLCSSEQTTSGRDIYWHKLPHFEASIYFGDIGLHNEGISFTSEEDKEYFLSKIINICGNYPRPLSLIKYGVIKNSEWTSKDLNSIITHTTNTLIRLQKSNWSNLESISLFLLALKLMIFFEKK